MLCYVVLCCVMLCCVVLCYVVLCCVMLCCVVLCYVVLCCVALCCVVSCQRWLAKLIIFIRFFSPIIYLFIYAFVYSLIDLNYTFYESSSSSFVMTDYQVFLYRIN